MNDNQMLVTKVAVSVTSQVDTGYAAHVQYVDECLRKRMKPEFGMRKNETASVFLSETLENPEGVTQEVAANIVKEKLVELMATNMHLLKNAYPEAFVVLEEEDVVTETDVKYGDPDEF